MAQLRIFVYCLSIQTPNAIKLCRKSGKIQYIYIYICICIRGGKNVTEITPFLFLQSKLTPFFMHYLLPKGRTIRSLSL